jgi:flagellar protein FlgJ
VLVAQSALETGWGRAIMKREDGSSGNNMFGIKADGRWQGERITANALEYIDGQMIRRPEQFRAYESGTDSFEDYVNYLHSNPRYSQALKVTTDSAAYLHELQRAGYATDPNYADKILSIVEGKRLNVANKINQVTGV